jgi:N6-L-threonylcarbamoyladenine synthase
VLIGGGVSANGRLREVMEERLAPGGRVFRASPRLSLDNAAMVARAGRFHLERGGASRSAVEASASLPFPGMVRRRDVLAPHPH